MKMIGDAARFAVEIGPADSSSRQMRIVNIYVGGKNISEVDNAAYVPQFVTSLRRAADALKRKIDYAKYEPLFLQHSLEEAYQRLAADEGELFGACRVLDLGATTDSSLSFLIPYCNRLYLASRTIDEDEAVTSPLAIVEITAYDIVRVLESTIEVLENA